MNEENEIQDNLKETVRNEVFFDLGNRWEKFVKTILEEQENAIEVHKKFDNNTIADIYIGRTRENSTKIIECKLYARKREVINTVVKYGPFCDEIEIWSLADKKYLYRYPKEIEINLKEFYIGLAETQYSTMDIFNYALYANNGEFNRTIKVKLLYYQDIMNDLKNNELKKKCELLQKQYQEYGYILHSPVDLNKLLKFDKGFLEKINTENEITYEDIYNYKNTEVISNEVNGIPINNSIKNKSHYKICFGDVEQGEIGSFRGIIRIFSIRKFKFPEQYINANAPKELLEKDFIELKVHFKNTATFNIEEMIFEDFYITDGNNSFSAYKNLKIATSIIKKDLIQKHLHDPYNKLKPNQSKMIDVYFMLDKDIVDGELYLKCDGMDIECV